jgi:hypothetical protein
MDIGAVTIRARSVLTGSRQMSESGDGMISLPYHGELIRSCISSARLQYLHHIGSRIVARVDAA